MPPFFIYCLPRSGSAWLSIFLTAFDSYCYHEPLADMSLEQLSARWTQRPDWTVGAVDTSAYRHHGTGTIKKTVPRARAFVLRRSVADIQASSDAHGVRYDAAEESGRLLNITHGLPVIDYHQLFDVHYLRDLWAELIGTPFDRERAEMLTEFNIQRDMRRFLACRPHLTGPDNYRELLCH